MASVGSEMRPNYHGYHYPDCQKPHRVLKETIDGEVGSLSYDDPDGHNENIHRG